MDGFLPKSKYGIIFILLSLVLVLFACSSETSDSQEAAQEQSEENNQGESNNTADSTPQYGGHAVIGTQLQTPTFGYPVEYPTTTRYSISAPALESLGRYDLEGNLTPWLAEKWDLDPENATVTIKLKEGIKFHDGTDFNAEAVKWNIELWKEKKKPIVEAVESVEVLSEYELKINFSKWVNGAFDTICIQLQMISPTAFKENGEDWVRTNPVGTGPFKFDSHQSDVFIRYVKNEDYWIEGLPYLDSLEYQIIPDPNTAKNAFLGGDLHVHPNLTAEIIDELKNMNDSSFEIVELKTSYGLTGNGIVGNSADPNSPFANVKVRQALNYAINREEIANSVYRGYAIPSNQYGLPDAWYYNPNLDFEFNPEKARELLAEAGYGDGFKTTLTGLPTHQVLMQAVQGYLADIGIDVEVVVAESARYAELSTQVWDGLMVFAYTTDVDMGSALSRNIGPSGTTWGPGILVIEEVQDLLDRTASATDMDSRIQLSHELQEIIYDKNALMTSLFVNTIPYVRSTKVHDDGFYTIWGYLFTPEKMWIEQ